MDTVTVGRVQRSKFQLKALKAAVIIWYVLFLSSGFCCDRENSFYVILKCNFTELKRKMRDQQLNTPPQRRRVPVDYNEEYIFRPPEPLEENDEYVVVPLNCKH